MPEYQSHDPLIDVIACYALCVVNKQFTLSSSKTSLSCPLLSRPSLLSVQPVSQGGRVDLSAASSGSGFTLVSNKMREKTLLERVTATENYFIMQKQKVLKKLKLSPIIFLPFLPVGTKGLAPWRPPALRVQNCSCSKLCLMSQPLSLSRDRMSAGSVLMSSAKHSSCR